MLFRCDGSSWGARVGASPGPAPKHLLSLACRPPLAYSHYHADPRTSPSHLPSVPAAAPLARTLSRKPLRSLHLCASPSVVDQALQTSAAARPPCLTSLPRRKRNTTTARPHLSPGARNDGAARRNNAPPLRAPHRARRAHVDPHRGDQEPGEPLRPVEQYVLPFLSLSAAAFHMRAAPFI